MSRPLNVAGPPTTQIRCTLYFWTWACGHKECVHCSNCDLAEPNNYRAHLGHEHREVGLSAPRHPCPACNHPPLIEDELASLNSPLFLEARRNLAIVNKNRLVRNARVAEEVEAIEAPWRQGFDEADMTPDDRLTSRILMDNWRTVQLAQRLEEWQRGFSTQGRPSEPGNVSTARPPPPQQAADESTTPTQGSQQTTPRQPAPRGLATGLAGASQQRSGHVRRQSSASAQSASGSGLPVPSLIPNRLMPLLIPQLAYSHPSNTQWGTAQRGQVRRTSRRQQYRLWADASQPSGFEPANVPQQHGGNMAFGSTGRGHGWGQVRNTFHPPRRYPSHHRQPSFFAPGSSARGGGPQGASGANAGQSHGHHAQPLHHSRPHPHPLRGGHHVSGNTNYRGGHQQHYPSSSRGTYEQEPHRGSHIGFTNPHVAPFRPQGSNTPGPASGQGSRAPSVRNSPEAGSAEHGEPAQAGEDVEQAADNIENLHISNRGR
ncbi:MAG: hypothetical protein L6R41_001696 [Letrouitia leprolyta]|nr:MAG: hypothetical protein L6R41_001696 [Letrouitia leprolyta]